MGSLITPGGPWLAPYQPTQRYHLTDLQRVAADDLPYRNLLRAGARLEQSRTPQDAMRTVAALQRWLPNRSAVTAAGQHARASRGSSVGVSRSLFRSFESLPESTQGILIDAGTEPSS